MVVCPMKNLVLAYDDEDFAKLKGAKGKMTWHNFFLFAADNMTAAAKKEVSKT
jgi:hypothetical protein